MSGKIRIYPPKFLKGKFRRVNIYVSGLVQGVFFRDSTQKKARELKLRGWVSNLEDGRVEILAEGKKEKIEELIKWAKKGPLNARVDNFELKEEEYKGEFGSFEIRY